MPIARGIARALPRAIRDEAQSVVGISVGATASAAAIVIGLPDEKVARLVGGWWSAVSEPLFFGLVVLASLLFVIALARIAMRLRPSKDPVPIFRRSRFTCKVLETDQESALLNSRLVAQVFPNGSIDADHARRAQQKNRCRLIGLIDTMDGEIAGWSSLWPVTKEAGEAIERGKRTDDDLKVDDLLPQNRNSKANYLILLSFCTLPEYRNASESPALRLGRYVIGHIIQTFLATSDRQLRLVAVAYSREGERMCRLLGLQQNGCYANYPSGHSKPIYAGDVSIDSLTEISKRL